MSEKMKTDLSRRSFLMGAGIAAAAAAGTAMVGCSNSSSSSKNVTLPSKWDQEADFVIIGAGAAGLSAAITAAAENLGSVLLCDAAPDGYEGGNSRACAQILFIPNNADDAFTYQKNLNGAYEVEDDLMKAWAKNMGENYDWLTGLGATLKETTMFAPEYPSVAGSSCAKCYLVDGTMGKSALWNFLKKKADELGVTIQVGTRITGLISDQKTHEVFGVTTDGGKNFKANKGVVLACGGFENNKEMMQNNYMSGYPNIAVCGTPYNRGDGIKMAESVGAQLWHMNSFAGPYMGTPVADSWLPDDVKGSQCLIYNQTFGAKDWIFVGADGKRFMLEERYTHGRHGKLFQGGTYVTMATPAPGYCIMGPQTVAASSPLGTINKGWGYPNVTNMNKIATNDDYIKAGMMAKCDTIADLAKYTGYSEATLTETINTYNDYAAKGYDPEFHRGEAVYDDILVAADGSLSANSGTEKKPSIEAFTLVPIQAPYYAFKMVGGLLNTQGGPKRSAQGEVVDPEGNAIPRLYAAGELGTIYTYMYNGGGNVTEAISSGRLAVRSASQLSAWK